MGQLEELLQKGMIAIGEISNYSEAGSVPNLWIWIEPAIDCWLF
jgi:hypothetical protein